uniref:Uncharacterized protein n=1 Tax=Glossina palpalis gambiensis TaxID=67801 RepID=A0A1B0BSB2_9MUSC
MKHTHVVTLMQWADIDNNSISRQETSCKTSNNTCCYIVAAKTTTAERPSYRFEEKQNGAYMLQMIARKRSKMLNIKVVILAQIITKITDHLENNKFV